MALLILIYGFCGLQVVFSLPDGNNSRILENLSSEMAAVQNTMKVLSDQWEKWNTLFITSLEPRITSTASTLSSIDSNIHNLQGRAHVWDTFQLHVSAWNEQLAALDRKMTILSKGMEEVMAINNKVDTILSEEYKLDKLLKMMTSLTESDKRETQKTTKDSLFEEFASRGILSSLKLLERKVDKLLIMKQNNDMDKIMNQDNTSKCKVSKATENVLNDISSKVDTIFDAVYKKIENDYSEDYLEVKDVEGSGDQEFFDGGERFRAVRGGFHLSRNYECSRSIERNFRDINMELSRMEYNITKIIKKEFNNISNISSNIGFETSDLEEIFRNFSSNFSIDQSMNMNLILESYFNENRAYLESMFRQYASKNFKRTQDEKIMTGPSINVPTSTESSVFSPDGMDFMETSGNATVALPRFDVNTKQFLSENGSINTNNVLKIVDRASCDNLEYDSTSGVYIFKNSYGDVFTERFFNKQFCEVRDDGLWTVIQRRDNYSMQHDFNASWDDYKLGFGDLSEDFWLGNNHLARLSKIYNLTLRIELGDFDGNRVWAEYATFKIDTEINKFKLTVGGYSGNASDAFSSHSGAFFSTYDRKNDAAPDCCPCSVSYGGGWWFTSCFESNLNGIYYRKPYENDYFRGIIWEHWLGNYSLKKSIIMIKYKGLVQSFSPNITQVEDP